MDNVMYLKGHNSYSSLVLMYISFLYYYQVCILLYEL